MRGPSGPNLARRFAAELVPIVAFVARMGEGVNVCRTTGLTMPECSCRSCIHALLSEHMPTLAEPPELRFASDGAPGLGMIDSPRASRAPGADRRFRAA